MIYDRGQPPPLMIHAPNLFLCLQEALKHILFSLITSCITRFSSYLTLKISHLTSFLSKVVRLLPHVFMVKTSLKVYKSVSCLTQHQYYKKNRSPKKKKNLRRSNIGGSKILWFFVKASLSY